jgi:hypothetical protein
MRFMTVSARCVVPEPGEYLEYYGRYIALVSAGDIVQTLAEQLEPTLAFLRALPEAVAREPYAVGKWTVKGVAGHLIDTERVFAYRALTFARGDAADLPGMDQDAFMVDGNFGARALLDLCDEWENLRQANVRMFAGFPEAAWTRSGRASGSSVSVRALAFIIAGHERHHLKILRAALQLAS